MDFEELASKVLLVKVKAVEKVLADLATPLDALKNPEKLMGKPYEEWTEEDIARLKIVYGQEPNLLTDFILKKKIEEVKKLSSEVVML